MARLTPGGGIGPGAAALSRAPIGARTLGTPRLGRRLVAIVVVLFTALGLWHTGHAVWIQLKARVAQQLLQRAWTRAVAGGADARPWPWADFTPVARLRAPGHGVDLIVLSGVSGRTLAFGPGHAAGTAAPGARGTAIITGHRDTHFRFLERVRPGDELLVEAPRLSQVRFVVRETTVVDSRAASIRSAEDGAALVLLTCYPFDAVTPGGPLRYAVLADRAAP